MVPQGPPGGHRAPQTTWQALDPRRSSSLYVVRSAIGTRTDDPIEPQSVLGDSTTALLGATRRRDRRSARSSRRRFDWNSRYVAEDAAGNCIVVRTPGRRRVNVEIQRIEETMASMSGELLCQFTGNAANADDVTRWCRARRSASTVAVAAVSAAAPPIRIRLLLQGSCFHLVSFRHYPGDKAMRPREVLRSTETAPSSDVT